MHPISRDFGYGIAPYEDPDNDVDAPRIFCNEGCWKSYTGDQEHPEGSDPEYQ